MRLQRLWIGEFRNLRGVVLDFEARRRGLYGGVALTFLVGTNGSGKSNALDAIGMIFSHLDVGIAPGFAFDLEYEIRDQRVRVATPSRVDLDGVRPVAGIDVVLIPGRRSRCATGRSTICGPASRRSATSFRYASSDSRAVTRAPWAGGVSRSAEHELAQRERGADPRLADEDLEIRRTNRRALLDDRSIVFLDSSDAVLAALAVLAHPGGEVDDLTVMTEIIKHVGLATDTALVAFSARSSG